MIGRAAMYWSAEKSHTATSCARLCGANPLGVVFTDISGVVPQISLGRSWEQELYV